MLNDKNEEKNQLKKNTKKPPKLIDQACDPSHETEIIS
jgi:hypothetical protein